VTIQAQIMDLLDKLGEEKQMATLLISHDLGVVAAHADHVTVMYAGLIVEQAPVGRIFANPMHPYTRGLLACIPRFGNKGPLPTIKGQVPDAVHPGEGCSFLERCPEPFAPCGNQIPPLSEVEPGHVVRCWRS
jgi:oligopeptide/dipeptide ABC transporter ATP-binding protein